MSTDTHRVPVCVVIVSWNTRQYLQRCLSSLAAEVAHDRCHIVVVDNGSSDGSPAMVEADFPRVHLIRAPVNGGFGAAVNLGVDSTDAEWVIAANADIEVPAGTIDALIAAARRSPRASAIAPRLILPDGSQQQSVFSFPRLRTALGANLGIHRLIPAWERRARIEARWNPAVEQSVDYAMGAFLLIRRDAFDAVGGFDEKQWMFAEDMDLCWRLQRAGWSTVYTPDASVMHIGGASMRTAFKIEETEALRLGALYAWLRVRRGSPIAAAFVCANLMGAAARLTFAAFLARVIPSRYGTHKTRASAWFGITLHAVGMMRGARTDTSGYAR